MAKARPAVLAEGKLPSTGPEASKSKAARSEAACDPRLGDADGFPQLFDLAKQLVDEHLGESRVGIMLGLQSLGLSPSGFLGGYYVAGSNAIVLNRDVIAHVQANHPEYANAYTFHVLLHEYLHSLGYFDEQTVREHAYEVTRRAFGSGDPATQIAAAMTPGVEAAGAPQLFRRLTMPPYGWKPDDGGSIEYVRGIDRDATDYIA